MTDKQIIIDDQNKIIHILEQECTEKMDIITALGNKLKAKEQEYEELRQYHNKCCEENAKKEAEWLEKFNQVSIGFYNGDYCNTEHCSLLKSKEQECEELKIYIESNEQQVKEVETLVMDNDRLINELDQLKAENEELKSLLKVRIEDLCDSCGASSMKLMPCKVYEKTLTEIKNKLTVHKTLYYESKLIEKLHKKILQKISEVEDETTK